MPTSKAIGKASQHLIEAQNVLTDWGWEAGWMGTHLPDAREYQIQVSDTWKGLGASGGRGDTGLGKWRMERGNPGDFVEEVSVELGCKTGVNF